jgi:spore maturation protein CgeB
MRILIIAPFGEGFLADSYAKALESNGHEIYCFDSDRAYFESASYARNRFARRLFRAMLWNKLNFSTVELVRCVKPNLVLVFKGAFLHPETIRRIRANEGVPIANYYPDNPYCGVPLDPRKTSAQRRDLIDALREYTFVLTWERGLVKRLKADGVSASYVPFGVDTNSFSPMEKSLCNECRNRHSVVFVGQHDIKREQHVDAIRKNEVALWGARWSRAKKRFGERHVIHKQAVFGTVCAVVYSSAEISLNIVGDLNIPGHNMRTFEIPACGGVMLSTFTKEQAEFFPEGEAAFYYRDPSELDSIIDRLLGDEGLRKRVKQRALKLAQHNDYRNRARDLLKILSA